MVRFKNRWLLLSVAALPSPRPTSDDTAPPSDPIPIPRPEHVPSNVTAPNILREVRAALERYFGDAGSGTAGGSLAIRYYNARTGTAILRCARENARLVWASIAMITHFEAVRCRIVCKHLSGTIKKAQLYAIDQERKEILRLRQAEQRYERRRAQRRANALDAVFASDANASSDPSTAQKRKRTQTENYDFDQDLEVRQQLEASKRQIMSMPATMG